MKKLAVKEENVMVARVTLFEINEIAMSQSDHLELD